MTAALNMAVLPAIMVRLVGWLVNAGGVHRFGAPERAGKTNVYIDMDPAYTQIRLAGADRVLRDLLGEQDVHFTFGENIGNPECPVPVVPCGA